MKVLVTGGAGFIGSHVVDGYLDEGHEVAVVDDLSTGRTEWLNPRARFHEIDIRNPALAEVFEREKPELVSHQAAMANVRESMQRPGLYADVNIVGSINLLECARRHGVGRFVYASTGGAVYGEPEANPVREDHPINPLDPYGASKHAVEHYLYLYRANYGFQYTSLRYPNVYGPRQDPHGEAGVVAIFANQMLGGGEPVINGDGTQERDFVYVSDIVRANLLAARADSSGTYNIGTGTGTSINRVFETLARHTGYQREAAYGTPKAGEVYKIFLDAGLARRELGWKPEVPLEEGVRATIEFFRRKAH